MKYQSSPIIEVHELLKLYNSDNLIIIDARSGINAKSNYDENHLKGAIFIDLNTQLAEIKDDLSIGGRHPLPTLKNFVQTISDLGITPESHVIIYDDKNGSNASSRFWWMLKAIGHNNAQVLNGGIQAAKKWNLPMSSNQEIPYKTKYKKVGEWQLQIAEIKEVEESSKSLNHLIIDVREPERFNGENEPIDLIAGHIPNAINIPFTENLDENGFFLTPNILKIKYEKVFNNLKPQNIIVHCGSGVTACHTLLAIAYAGLEIPKLYVGSWSEWSRNNKDMVLKP